MREGWYGASRSVWHREVHPQWESKQVKVIEKEGSIYYMHGGFVEPVLFGKVHRTSTPARIYSTGASEWFGEGKSHRKDGPSVLGPDGDSQWWVNGELHREGAPARIYSDGYLEWWRLGRKQEPGGHGPSKYIEWSPKRTLVR